MLQVTSLADPVWVNTRTGLDVAETLSHTGSDLNLVMLALHTGITFFVSEESWELSCGYDLFLSLT